VPFAYGVELSGQLVAIIGLEFFNPSFAEIRQIVVIPSQRGRGIGRAMIAAAVENFNFSFFKAETDRNAVDFYRRCGFLVRSLGELYPSTERFECILTSVRY